MANYAILSIGDKDFRSGWYIQLELLLPFKPNDYDGKNHFVTTVKKALENLSQYAITEQKIEEKIAKIIHVDFKHLKKFRDTGIDELFNPDEEDNDSIELRLELFGEDHPELEEISELLKVLRETKEDEKITLDMEEIHAMYDDEEWYKNGVEIFQEAEENYRESLISINLLEDFKEVDVFINHDSNDKKDFVDELAKKLEEKGLNVWYDKFSMQVGDSIHKKIQQGLQDCRYGLVVLSQNFIQNYGWAQEEFESLKAKERIYNKNLILPIWRNDVSKTDVAQYNLELSERLALKENDGIDTIVENLVYKINS